MLFSRILRLKKSFGTSIFAKKKPCPTTKEGADWLLKNGFKIAGIVCDGLRGMFALFADYPVQMCQFHQISIVRRYLTQQPDLQDSNELLSLVKTMTHTDKKQFIGMFSDWEHKWSNFLKESSLDKKTGKTRYTHKRIRSTYLSLKRNMKELWTFSDCDKIGI